MLCRLVTVPRKKKTGSVPVYLNVYDLTPINGYAYWLGLVIYHSGVQVYGVEYEFGTHDHSTMGIFEVELKQCPGFTFRKSILIGRTDLRPKEVRAFMEKLAEEYSGNTYHLITNNCNHFCNDVCIKLRKKPILRWVNRLARLGLNETKVRQVRSDDRVTEGEKQKLRSYSSRFILASDSLPHPPLSSCPSGFVIKSNSRQRRCIPSASTLVHSSSTSTFSLKL